MIIIGLSDIHGHLSLLEKMKEVFQKADVVLLVGDITHFGGVPEARRVINAVTPIAKAVFAVSGNCDYREVDSYLDAGLFSLHGRGRVHDGIGFVGLGGSLVTPFQTPNEYSEREIIEILEQGSSGIPDGIPTVLVSHQPPFQSGCDQIASGAYVGSRAVRHYIEQHEPLVCFSGHIHESRGAGKIGITHIINPGMLKNGYYAYAEIQGNETSVDIRSVT